MSKIEDKIREIPDGFYHCNKYYDDENITLHLYNDKGESFDIKFSKI